MVEIDNTKAENNDYQQAHLSFNKKVAQFRKEHHVAQENNVSTNTRELYGDDGFRSNGSICTLGDYFKICKKSKSMAGSSMADSSMAGSSMAGSSMAGSSMADSSMADSSMADSSMADSSMADSSMAGSSMAGSSMAGSSMAGSL